MERRDNYRIQAGLAQQRFLGYDQQKLIEKLKLAHDEKYLYAPMLGQLHRICRATGALERQSGETWVDANSFGEVLTFLDLLCDSREDRFLAGSWKNLLDFGRIFQRRPGRLPPGLRRPGGTASSPGGCVLRHRPV